jgi:hypothetical protein
LFGGRWAEEALSVGEERYVGNDGKADQESHGRKMGGTMR